MSYHRPLGANGNGEEEIFYELVVEGQPRDTLANTYETMSAAMDAMMIASRQGKNVTVVSPPGSDNVMLQVGPHGRVRQVFVEDRSQAEALIREMDAAAVEVGEQMAREARRVPRTVIAVGGGAAAGALLAKNKVVGALGGAIAGYAIDQLLQRG